MNHGTRLDNKVAIVTGGGRGIGRATALTLAEMGAHVVVNDTGVTVEGRPDDPSVAKEAVELIRARGGSAVADTSDTSIFDNAAQLIQSTTDEHGRLDIVVNCAGTLRVQPIWEMTEEDISIVLASHLHSTFAMTRHACAWWRSAAERDPASSGRLVNMTAATGLVGRADLGANHAAAKGAVAALTLNVAHEMYPYNVTVNAVCAANVRGRMAEHVVAHIPDVEGPYDPGDPQHSANMICYLATDDAGWLTGQVIRVIGGVIGLYQPWQVVASRKREGYWSPADLALGMRKLMGTYPEHRPMQAAHRMDG
jgi:NAD(P)-dependent dehydrogenase (short-subunit alcohol dehydrogenase family)